MPHMIRRWTLIGTLLAITFSSGVCASQTEADWTWTNKHFGPLLDALMPLQSSGGLYVTYRANRDYVTSIPEYWFRIGYEFNQKRGYGSQNFFSAHVRIASPNSIYDQLMALRRSDPAAQETDNFKARIKLRSYDFTEMNCPAIKSQMEKFQKLQTKMPEMNGNVITIHPMNHDFYAAGAEGDMTLALTDDEHPVVRWALETRKVLEGCEQTR
jgi:hypothetical protein